MVRNRHILPQALGPELARYQGMDPPTYEMGSPDEAAIAVRCLSSFWRHWAERGELVAVVAALPPAAPGEDYGPSFMGVMGVLAGVEVCKSFVAPGRMNTFGGF